MANKITETEYIHWFHGETGVEYVDPIEGSTFCAEMECVNCAGRRPKEEEDRYREAKKNAFKECTAMILSMCRYKEEFGAKALSNVDDELHYLTPDTRIKLTHFQPFAAMTIQRDGWSFSVTNFLKQKTEITKVLSNYCNRGWFNLYVCEDHDGKVCCNVTVSKRRDV